MPYNKRFLGYIIKSRIINGSPKFKLYRYDSSTMSYVLLKELPAICEYIELGSDISARCTATDTSSDSYTVNKIELHVNTYSYTVEGHTYSSTKIDYAEYGTPKGASEQLKIVDKVTFTSTGYAEV